MSYERTNGGPFRNGRVLAPESRFTGEEPGWIDSEQWSRTKFMDMRERALRFYNYYLSPSELRLSLLEWMSQNKYDARALAAIKGAPDYVPELTASKLARAILRGMTPVHREGKTNDTAYIRARIKEALAEIALGLHGSRAQARKDPSPGQNPIDRVRAKVGRTVLCDLEEMLDSWITDAQKGQAPVFGLSLIKRLEANAIPGSGVASVKEWLDRYLREFTEAASGKDPALTQAYSYMPKRILKTWIESLKGMHLELETYLLGKKALRRPRAKRVKSADKQTAKLKFLSSSKEYAANSVSPLSIPGSRHLFLFNTAYKALHYYEADGPSGLSVRGSSILGFNPATSFVQGLRKPLIHLPIVLGKTITQIGKELEKLSTKRRPARGRVNADTLILRTI